MLLKAGSGKFIDSVDSLSSWVFSGWTGWALVYPEFGVSINPIPTGEGWQIMLTTLMLAPPPGFENLTTSLLYLQFT